MKIRSIIIILISILSIFIFTSKSFSDWTVSRTSINFGDVPVGASKSDVVVITNTGATPLNFQFYPSISELTFTTIGNQPVAAGASITLIITFKPVARGTYTGEILIASDDPNTPKTTVTITGNSTYSAGIDVSTRSINFGTVLVGSSKSESLRIINNGSSTINGYIVTTDGAPFSASEGKFSIRPGEVVNIIVTFSPTQKGSYNAALSIISDDRDTPKIVVSLFGSTGDEFPLLVYPTIINFGNTNLNTANERLLRLYNTSNHIIDVSINIFNVSGSFFYLSTGTSISFPMVPGETRYIPVRFIPSDKGFFSAILNINTNTGMSRISLLGNGSEIGTTGLEPQNPPPSSGGGGGGGCSVAGKVDTTNFGNALLMFAPAIAIVLRRFWRKIIK